MTMNHSDPRWEKLRIEQESKKRLEQRRRKLYTMDRYEHIQTRTNPLVVQWLDNLARTSGLSRAEIIHILLQELMLADFNAQLKSVPNKPNKKGT